jgi:hypothetical protein
VALELFTNATTTRPHQEALNVRKLLEARAVLGDSDLSPSLARAL